jgi:hypothetical protein
MNDIDKLPLIAAQLQSIHNDITVAYGLLTPILRYDKEIPAHASLTYQTFCVLLLDIKKQINVVCDNAIETNESKS